MCEACASVFSFSSETAISNFSRKLRLQLQRRDDRHQIGVAAALAEAVQRALDLARAGAHRRERVRHRLLGVIVGVDADMVARARALTTSPHDALDLVRQRAAIGVAQHHPARAGLVGRPGAGERIVRIGLVAVEEVLAVDQDLAALLPCRRHAVADRGEVLLVGGLERDAHVIVPRLRHEADRVGLGVEQGRKARIVRGGAPGPPRHAERREGRAELAVLAEQLGVGRVRARIAALDVVDAEVVEQLSRW